MLEALGIGVEQTACWQDVDEAVPRCYVLLRPKCARLPPTKRVSGSGRGMTCEESAEAWKVYFEPTVCEWCTNRDVISSRVR